MVESLCARKTSVRAYINPLPLELCKEVGYYYVFIIYRCAAIEDNDIDQDTRASAASYYAYELQKMRSTVVECFNIQEMFHSICITFKKEIIPYTPLKRNTLENQLNVKYI